ncbi:hypothetical protein A8C32_07060 [Flavivirga aquatica]|uniref:Uncharacterized protein n=1 Tax=Flavivirga aquatica TaxID=1849968 RepID=A0A1E5SIK2_9FLAO|nr:hypothetical protein [Flavivirga aquatica]OEJ98941.1 hypothetical protein A8C32_07060 [Flavivirga aquatica]
MKEKENKYLNNLTKKVIQEGSLECPSFNFTDDIMSQIELLDKKHIIIYKPLISKTIWSLILASFFILILYIVFGTQTESTGWLNKINFSILLNNKISNMLTGFKVSKKFVYAIVFLGIMTVFQVLLLKQYFNKRFQV